MPNQIWALDFMSDSLYQERRFRTLNILDEGVREAPLAIEIDTSLPAMRVVRALEQLETWRGLPQAIRLDNFSYSNGAFRHLSLTRINCNICN